jgi:hypothetical protein
MKIALAHVLMIKDGFDIRERINIVSHWRKLLSR